jgi:hypothetical protein
VEVVVVEVGGYGWLACDEGVQEIEEQGRRPRGHWAAWAAWCAWCASYYCWRAVSLYWSVGYVKFFEAVVLAKQSSLLP